MIYEGFVTEASTLLGFVIGFNILINSTYPSKNHMQKIAELSKFYPNFSPYLLICFLFKLYKITAIINFDLNLILKETESSDDHNCKIKPI